MVQEKSSLNTAMKCRVKCKVKFTTLWNSIQFSSLVVNVTGKILKEMPKVVVAFIMQSILRASQCRRKETCFIQVASADEKTLDLLEFHVFWGIFLVVHKYQVHQVSHHFWRCSPILIPLYTVKWPSVIPELISLLGSELLLEKLGNFTGNASF